MERRIVTVFGGSGFIGRYVVRRLAAAEWIVRVAVRNTESAQFLKVAGDPGQVVPFAADINDTTSVTRVVEGAGAVINLVGILYGAGGEPSGASTSKARPPSPGRRVPPALSGSSRCRRSARMWIRRLSTAAPRRRERRQRPKRSPVLP